MRAIPIVLCLLCSVGVMRAQTRLLLSQYMYNGLALNPAYAGSQQQFSLAGLHRDQWQNIDGAPSYQLVSMHTPLFSNRIGVGFLFSREKVGVHQDYSIFGAYAYKVKMRVGYLSMGLFGGISVKSSNYTLLQKLDEEDILLSYNGSTLSPNFGLGIYYYNSQMYAGLSVPYILNRRTLEIENVSSVLREPRSYYLTSGAVFGLFRSGDAVKINPSFLFKLRDNTPIGLDLNLNFILHSVVFAGVSYRLNNGVVMLTQLILNENLRIMYAYDFTTSVINQRARGTHEVMLNYRIVIRALSTDPHCSAYF